MNNSELKQFPSITEATPFDDGAHLFADVLTRLQKKRTAKI